ncbi:transposase [Streptomyces brasiliensis]|uniref:Transposase n=1 Tax=Streptomyces brasiliensis TaxID=1954 RepID=A0A917L6F4_9ACTN|nr:transposase [Streptomyces brasiliensis]GGJ44414.1 hypothetical protein GCM10010121_064510 [Streptomyces brasiliensis]
MGRRAADHDEPSTAKHCKPHPSPLGGPTIRGARPVPQESVGKRYPPEFKADAVALYQSRPGATIRSVAVDLGVNPETLRNWVRAAGASRPPGTPGGDARRASSAPLEAENAALRRKVRELEEEREILRKAAKHFAGETRGEPLVQAVQGAAASAGQLSRMRQAEII